MSNGFDPDQAQRLLVMVWVQTVYKGYEPTIKVTASKEIVKSLNCIFRQKEFILTLTMKI